MSNQTQDIEPKFVPPQSPPGRLEWPLQILLKLGTAIRDMVVDLFLRLKIRLKLSLIAGISIAVVTFIISSISVRLQESELASHTKTLGTNILQSLTAAAEDNLLLNTIPVLQDYVKNFRKQKIPGLEQLFVTDRMGKIVAHLESDSINLSVTPDEWEILARADPAVLVETPEHYRFVQAIVVAKETRKILLGGASLSFSKTALLTPIQKMKRTIMITSLLVAIGAISLVYLISKKIVHAIIVLSEAARRVGKGDLKATVVTRTKDEVGTLANEFNNMVHQIREKTEMQKFISKSTVQMISEGKEITVGGTRRVVTAMFTDIRNFTTVSEDRWPEEVVVLLNHYLDVQTNVIHEHKGVVDKFLGDGIMSIFTGPDMSQNAVDAAIKIQRKIARLNKEREQRGEVILEVGIGIATGKAVLGSIGSQERMDNTAIGDIVNLAARLCSNADAYEILVTETVVARLNGKVSTKSAGKLTFRGKHADIPVFQVGYSIK